MSPSATTPAADLALPVQYLKGVGPQRAELFQRLGLRSVRDVLFFFPRDYQDLTDLRPIAGLEEDKLQSVRGVVEEVELRGTGTGRSLLGVLVRQDHHYLRALWFNQPFMREKFTVGQEVLLSGKARLNEMRWEMAHPRVQTLESEDDQAQGQLLPVYPLTEGLNQGQARHVVRTALDAYADVLEETFPQEYLDAHDLWPIRTALPQLHFPDSKESLERARRRFVYQELLVLQLALALRREQYASRQAPRLEVTAKIDARIRRLLPFELTPGQLQAIAEISADLARTTPMNRLVQGEVGSGKTVVAVYAMLTAVAHGFQAALMAPTEVLARQHARTLSELLSSSHVRIALLTGGLTAGERRQTLEQIAAGEADIVVGTQAIVYSEVQFARLGVVVIDEQHKFGVRQRARLKQAAARPREGGAAAEPRTNPAQPELPPAPAANPATQDVPAPGDVQGEVPGEPHYLVMTATPIPRTLTMTMFGDLDVSTIRDQPPGRQPVHTYLAEGDNRAKWWEFFRKKLREGRQGFVVVPRVSQANSAIPPPGSESEGALIEADLEADETDAPAVPAGLEETFESLAHGELEAFRLDLVHGRLSVGEKEAAMEGFRRGQTQVLVATSVVEVGIDVPNATVMTVLDAQRFGLAQLHQLRGRISRGKHPGFCCLMADAQTDDAHRRLEAVVESGDGFRLAELDFQIRGPGDLLGTKQHGLPPLMIADLATDTSVLEEARGDAQQLVREDPGLSRPEHARLRRMALTRYGRALDLGDVG